MLACSSSDPAPAGDDDDDTKDAGKTSTSSSSASSTSTSSSSSTGGGMITGKPCVSEPGGTYSMVKATYKGADGICKNFTDNGNTQAKPSEVTFTKDAEGSSGVTGAHYTMTFPANPGAKIVLLFDADTCQLAGGEPPAAYPVADTDGKDITAKVTTSHVFEFHDKAVAQVSLVEVDSDPTGAKGTPCSFTVSATGTKK